MHSRNVPPLPSILISPDSLAVKLVHFAHGGVSVVQTRRRNGDLNEWLFSAAAFFSWFLR